MATDTAADTFNIFNLASILLSAIAIISSGLIFYINHVRNRKSEQIRIASDIFGRISPIEQDWLKIREKLKETSNVEGLERTIYLMFLELDYFAYLVLDKEITNKKLLTHYKPRMYEILKDIKMGSVYGSWLFTDTSGRNAFSEAYPNLAEFVTNDKKLAMLYAVD